MKKLVVGIDIAKDDFQVVLKQREESGGVRIKGKRKFKNTVLGHKGLVDWVQKREKGDAASWYVMEATGVYYEDLAYFLYESGQQVSVVLANQVKYFARSLNLHSKTDNLDASIIAQLGIERTLASWKPLFSNYKLLKALNRKRLGLVKQKNRAQSQLHALKYAHQTPDTAMDITRRQIKFYEEVIVELEQEIDRLVRADEPLNEKVEKVSTIKGVGRATVVTILCETNGFHLIRNIRQLVSYAGLDVVFNESGQRQGKTAISKRGNARIRACLYMPALSAKRHEQKLIDLFDRVVAKNPKIKQKGTVACMRKLLVLIYTLWTKNEVYDPAFEAA